MWGYGATRLGLTVASLGFIAALGIVTVFGRRVTRYLDASVDKREHLRKGYLGERLVNSHLGDLGDDWHIFNNLELYEGSDIDHIAIGPGGFFIISTKSSRGLFEVTEDGKLLHNKYPSDFAKKANAQAAELKTRLDALTGRDIPYAQAVVALPFGDVKAKKAGDVWLLTDDFIERFETATPERPLKRDQIAKTERAVATIYKNLSPIKR